MQPATPPPAARQPPGGGTRAAAAGGAAAGRRRAAAGADEGLEDLVFGADGGRAEDARDPGAADTEADGASGGGAGWWSGRRRGPEPDATADPDAGGGAADPRIAGRRLRYDSGRKPGTGPGMLRLFDPGGPIRLLSVLFGWAGPLATAALYPLTVFAALIIFHRLPEFWGDMQAGRSTLSLAGILALSMVTVNLFRTLCVGVTAHRHGATPRYFGVVLLFYLVPRFIIDEDGVRKLPREARLAVPAAALKSRLFLFGAGTVLWATGRHGTTLLPELALLVGQIGLLTFLITGLPLIAADGYRYMTVWFDQPLLRERAFHHVLGYPRAGAGGLRFPPPTSRERWAFRFYVAGVVLFMGLIATLFGFYVSTALRDRFGGTGVLIFFALAALILLWLSAMKRFRTEMIGSALREAMAEKGRAQAASRTGQGAEAPLPGGGAPGGGTRPPSRPGSMAAGLPQLRNTAPLPRLPAQAVGTPLARPLAGVYAENDARARRARWRTRIVLAALAAALAWVAFLPYRYEVGGDFTILPATRVQVNAGVSGELVEILVDEGDVVEAGQLLARLSDLEPRHQLAVRQAELARAQASLQGLLYGARPEDIDVAREQLTRAETLLPFYQAQAERAQTLLDRSAISDAEAERHMRQYVQAQQDVNTARVNLARVEAPATEVALAMAEAQVAALRAQVDYQMALMERTELRAPAAGRIVTGNLGLQLGRAMDAGELFAEIENHEIARAEVRISETDIGLVAVGDTVRLRAWAQSDVEWIGRVRAIAPVAEDERFGRAVRVRTDIPNDEGFFRPQMTGFAKIEGAEMRTWEAFTRLFDRFFRIEVWGWIP